MAESVKEKQTELVNEFTVSVHEITKCYSLTWKADAQKCFACDVPSHGTMFNPLKVHKIFSDYVNNDVHVAAACTCVCVVKMKYVSTLKAAVHCPFTYFSWLET